MKLCKVINLLIGLTLTSVGLSNLYENVIRLCLHRHFLREFSSVKIDEYCLFTAERDSLTFVMRERKS